MDSVNTDLVARMKRRKIQLQRLEGLRVMDDDFMRCVLKNNLPLAQHVLRIVTGIEDLTLVYEETQYDIKALDGAHSVALDTFGVDVKGTEYDLEVQTGSDANPKRLRYYSAITDIAALPAGSDYSVLPEQWVVFIMEKDPYDEGKGTYLYARTDLQSGRRLDDGTNILYANGSYRGNDSLGSLMADFCQSDPDLIRDELLRKRVHYLKKTPEGRSEMCQAFEDTYNEGFQQGREQGMEQGMEQGREQNLLKNAKSVMDKLAYTAQEALSLLNVPASEQPRYLKML